MSTIKVPQLNKSFTADSQLSLMQNLVNQKIPVASSCGGDGICGKCLVKVESKNLSPMEELEMKTLQKNSSPQGCRLSCQLKVTNDIIVETTYW